MKSIFLLLAAATAAGGQTRTASISGAVLDARTQTPIAAVMVTAIRDGLPPFSRNAKSGGDARRWWDGFNIRGNRRRCG